MLEKEIKFITDFSLNKVKRLGSFFTIENLINAKVHPAIIRYISAELEYLINLDRERLLQKSAFDYSLPQVTEHFNKISAEILKNKLLPYEDVKKLVQQAVTFNINYLLRPNWTLMKFCYDNDEIRSLNEIKALLNYSYFYDYIKNITLAVLEKRKNLSITHFEFRELIVSVQNQLLKTQFETIIDNGLFSINEFVNLGEFNRQRISVSIVEVFLKEKGLNEHIYKVRKILSVDPRTKLDIEDFRAAIYSDIEIDFDALKTEEESEIERTLTKSLVDEVEEKSEFSSVKIEEEIDEAELENFSDEEVVLENKLESIYENLDDDLETEKFVEDLFDDKEEITDLKDDELYIDEDEKNRVESPQEKEIEKIIDEDEIDLDFEEEKIDFVNEEELVDDEIKLASLFDGIEDDFSFDEKEFKMEIDEEIVEEKKNASSSFEKFVDEDDVDLEENLRDKKDNEDNFTSEKDDLSFDEILEDEIENIHHKNELDTFSIKTTDDENNISDEDILEIAEEIKEIIKEPQILSKVDFVEEKSNQSNKNKSEQDEKEKIAEEVEIFNFFTTKETMKIISVVFNQDSVDFVNTLERIAECKNNEQGNEILKSVFSSYKINPFSSKEAKMLQEKVEQFFRHKCL